MESAVTLMAIVVMILSLSNGGNCRRCYQCADQQITGLGTFTPGGLPTCSGDSFGQQVECPVSPIPGFDLSCTITKHNYRSVLNGVEINSTLFSRDCGPGPSDLGCYHLTSDLSDPSLEELAEVGYSVLESNITICFCNQDLCNGDFDFENAADITNPTIPPGLNGYPFGGGMGGDAGSTKVTTTGSATAQTGIIGVLLVSALTYVIL